MGEARVTSRITAKLARLDNTAVTVWSRCLSLLMPAIMAATGASAQSDSLRPFTEAEALEGTSEIVRDIMGFDLAFGPGGFVLGGYNLLNPRIEDRFDTGRILPRIDVQPETGERLNCTDMACIESALQSGIEFMQPGGFPLPPEARDGPSYMVPLKSADVLETRHERARQILFATTGILLPRERNSMVIEAVEGASPAFSAGLRPGYELTRSSDGYANAESLANAARTGHAMTLFFRADPQNIRETQAGLIPRSGELTVSGGIIGFGGAAPSGGELPAAFRSLTQEMGLMALVQGNPDLAPVFERRVAALRILEGWSAGHAARACMTGPVVQIDIRTSIKGTETNLIGQSRDWVDASSVDPLFVEERFVPFVRSMTSSWSSPETVGAIEAAAAQLVQLEGCNGATVQKIRGEIAKLAGITLPDNPAPAGASGSFADWRSFMAQCYPNYMQSARSEGRNLPERGAVAMCICLEYGVAEYGDPDFYAGYRAWSFDGIPHDTQLEIWALTQDGACTRGGIPESPELQQRYQTFLQDNGL